MSCHESWIELEFDLGVTGPDGYRSTVLHGECCNSFEDGGLWEQNLPVPGGA